VNEIIAGTWSVETPLVMKNRFALLIIGVVPMLTSSCASARSPEPNTPFFEAGVVHTIGGNPAIVTGEKGSWDDRVLESGDCFKDGDTYYWYHHAHKETDPDAGYQIGVATATDPLGPWTKYSGNPILEVSDNEWETQYVATPMIVKEGNTYYMFYNGSDYDWHLSICLATATNPLGPWEKYAGNPMIDHRKFGFVGSVVKVNGTCYLYSVPPDEVQPDYGRMYVATANAPEGPWTLIEKPVLSEGPKGSWDEGGFSEAEVLHHNEMFHVFYGGSEFNRHREKVRESIGYAYSTDGYHFTKYEGNPVIPYQNVPNCSAMAEVHAVIEYPRIYIYHTLRYLETPQGENREWMPWIEHLGIQVLEDPDPLDPG
jgi:hypothetical protein